MTYAHLNPNYKESLEREWYVTSTQLLPPEKELDRLKSADKNMKTLDLSCRQLHGSRIEMVCDMAKNNASITEIDARGNGFDADGLYAIVEALKTMPNVKKLNLRGNNCRNEGVTALGAYLKNDKTLVELNLNENLLGDEGAIEIAEGLKANKTLQVIDLSLNFIGDEVILERIQ
uniref:Uncharacterized protein n=1 Tax=Chrysotila carterae TaxID=13221 RepID=A0A7S4B8C8_CHRCT